MNLDRQQSGFVLPELKQLARADAGSHARARMSSAHEDAIARTIGTPDFAAASARWEQRLKPPQVTEPVGHLREVRIKALLLDESPPAAKPRPERPPDTAAKKQWTPGSGNTGDPNEDLNELIEEFGGERGNPDGPCGELYYWPCGELKDVVPHPASFNFHYHSNLGMTIDDDFESCEAMLLEACWDFLQQNVVLVEWALCVAGVRKQSRSAGIPGIPHPRYGSIRSNYTATQEQPY